MSLDDNVLYLPQTKETRLQFARKKCNNDEAAEILDELKSLASEGYDEALVYLGAIYEFGARGITADTKLAIDFYYRSIHATECVESYLGLGRIYYFGKNGFRDLSLARSLYETVDGVSESAVPDLMLGRMWHHGEGGERDLLMARKYFERARAKGSVYSLTNLAKLELENGHYIRSIFLRTLAAVRAFLITVKNPHDSRLRQS